MTLLVLYASPTKELRDESVSIERVGARANIHLCSECTQKNGACNPAKGLHAQSGANPLQVVTGVFPAFKRCLSPLWFNFEKRVGLNGNWEN